jgi:hypothetical protein
MAQIQILKKDLTSLNQFENQTNLSNLKYVQNTLVIWIFEMNSQLFFLAHLSVLTTMIVNTPTKDNNFKILV